MLIEDSLVHITCNPGFHFCGSNSVLPYSVPIKWYDIPVFVVNSPRFSRMFFPHALTPHQLRFQLPSGRRRHPGHPASKARVRIKRLVSHLV